MLVEMSRVEFETHDDASLVWACIEPTISKIRGRSLAVKTEFSTGLTEGQRALLMFQVLYGHARNGAEVFFTHLSYMLSKQGVWDEFMRGALFFDDEQLRSLISDMANAYFQNKETPPCPGKAGKDSVNLDLIDSRLSEILPVSLGKVARTIRSSPELFILLTE